MKILVTGGNSFIGRHLCEFLEEKGHDVIEGLRSLDQRTGRSFVVYGDIGPATDWNKKLNGIDVIVHLASRVHIIQEQEKDPLKAFRYVNTSGTQNLVKAAAKQGVKKLIFLSSIGVNGNETLSSPFTEKDTPKPHNAYAQSKWEAEQTIHEVMQASHLNCIIIRSPLVYGPGVVANFLSLLKIIKTGLPLPFGAVNNSRSYICIYNLVDFIHFILMNNEIMNETFLISDDDDISTPDLINALAQSINKKTIVLSFPRTLLNLTGNILKKRHQINSICNSLKIDVSKAKQTGWSPKIKMQKGLKLTASWYFERY
ncbi:MAG: NAD-dependent epimerase/dehydratase family protein [Desulfobacteraceae bacterium]|nr:NAD-dependent epimerase/dehydratase family protein [Desulfobacteraceae bacterium]